MMEPIDFRDANFEALRDRLVGQRALVYAAWIQHGPCTTEELAAKSGLSILSLRPRTTELYQLGFVTLAGAAEKCGIYRALTDLEARIVFDRKQRAAGNPQGELPL